MGRPQLAVRPVEKTISLPEDLCGTVDLMLFSEVEGRVPHGAWARYITQLIRTDIAQYRKPDPHCDYCGKYLDMCSCGTGA